MILKRVWYIVKGVKKTFSLAVYKWFCQMNIKESCIESNDYFSCPPNFKSLLSFRTCHPYPSETRTKARRALDRSNPSFLYCHPSQRQSGLELLVISWQRTPSPGLTVKGGKTLICALGSALGCAWVGEGLPSALECNETLLPPAGRARHSPLQAEAGNLCP